jgi:hypothetical protein
VVFRNGGKVNANEKWFYDNKEIEIVNNFTYLGVLLNTLPPFLNTTILVFEVFTLNDHLDVYSYKVSSIFCNPEMDSEK